MATRSYKLGARIFGGILGGIVGYILMTIMASMNIFPTSIEWAAVGLFAGVVFGAFHDRLEGFLEE